MIVAVVMVLQRIEGCSDREAVDRFAYDLRWKYAAGGLDFDYPGFVHTVLVDMRARLAASERSGPGVRGDAGGGQGGGVGRPAAGAGLDGVVRRGRDDGHGHVDPLGDPRGAGGVRVVGAAGELRAVLTRDDDYRSGGQAGV